MNHRSGLDRSQTLLFPERLEDYIGPENPVRFLDAFVGRLDLAALGFAKAQCAATGTPPYDPAILLKLYSLWLPASDSLLPVVGSGMPA
jgi:transposase